jgi:hypothetical protein
VVVVVVAATPNYLRQASQNLGIILYTCTRGTLVAVQKLLYTKKLHLYN